jgi:hypothetical protein
MPAAVRLLPKVGALTRRPAPRLAILALGTFAIGTDGFIIAGVLPDMALGFPHETGQSLRSFLVVQRLLELHR